MYIYLFFFSFINIFLIMLFHQPVEYFVSFFSPFLCISFYIIFYRLRFFFIIILCSLIYLILNQSSFLFVTLFRHVRDKYQIKFNPFSLFTKDRHETKITHRHTLSDIFIFIIIKRYIFQREE